MKQATSYLSRLRFDQKLKNSLQARFLSNPRLTILLILMVIIAGVASFTRLPRQLNPDIDIPLVIISAVLPGAGPADVESLLTIPVEDAVSGVEGVKEVQSTSRDSVSVTTIEFDTGIDADKARTDVQSAVDTVELPQDAQTPRVQKVDFQNQPVWTFTVIGINDPVSLNRFAKRLESELEEKNTIDRVEISGLDQQEVQVVLKPEVISTYQLNPLSLSQLISSATGSYPAGSVETEKGLFTLTIDPQIVSVSDVRELIISVNGTPVPLSAIAVISERSKPNQTQTFYATKTTSAQQSITLSVFKTKATNINKAVADAEIVVEELLGENSQFTIETILNTSEEVDDQFSELARDFWIIMSLVFLMVFVFLGLRQALAAALSGPLTFLISFAVMDVMGITLNFLSLFSLLLSLGLLVDDTIVVVSAMTSYFRTKKFTPLQTGLLVWRDFLVAVFTTTITTVWAFLPLLLSSGIIGEFIKSIPIVVSATLLGSFFVAMFLILPLMILLLDLKIPNRVVIFLRILLLVILLGIFFAIIPKGPFLILEVLALVVFLLVTNTVRRKLIRSTKTMVEQRVKASPTLKKTPSVLEHGLIHFDVIASRYRRLIHRILSSKTARKRTIIMVVIFSVFSYLLLPLGFVKNEFFPPADYPLLYISIEMPAGTNAATSERESLKLLDEVKDTQGLKFATATVGQSYNSQEGSTSGGESNNILITLTLEAEKDRKSSSIDIARDLREEFAMYEAGKLSVNEVSGGPPAGSDLQIQLKGADLEELDAYAEKTVVFLETQEGITTVSKSTVSSTSKIVFVPDEQKLAQQEVGAAQIGLWLRLFAAGVTADSVSFAEDSGTEKDITIRMSEGVQSVESLGSIRMTRPTGGSMALSELGTFTLEPNPTLISRDNGDRTISVSAGVEAGYNIPEQNTKLENFANTQLDLAQGYTWETGGVNEENNASVTSIMQAMLLSFLLIVITMVLQFSSFRKAIIVMLVIPLSISGVFIIFALTQTPLSFPALIGVLALFGIVVKNSILVVDKIGQNEKAGMNFVDSIADASSSRLEAIALTSMTAIVGLIPITLSDPLWRGLGGAIIAGLMFSGTIMLFFIPVVYSYWFDPTKPRG